MTIRIPRTDSRHTDRSRLVAQTQALLADGFKVALVACHDDGDSLRAVYVFTASSPDRRVELVVAVPRDDAWVPTLAGLSYTAGRFEREMRDMFGLRPDGHPLPQRLVRHGHWPQGWYPMLHDADPNPDFGEHPGTFPFLDVEGDGVYEIPVGPVHAGLIEPGHFRFYVVGETILRMKARLWFVHRGVERLFEGRDPAAGIELAERISGDTAVGHSVAYAMAVESAADIEVGLVDRQLRALLLELERAYNHVGDMGMIANDVGYGIANAHAQRIRESLLRVNRAVTGHRLLRGAVSIGGTQVRELPDETLLLSITNDVAELAAITLGQSMVMDRLTDTAVLSRNKSLDLGTLGYVARASDVSIDARVDHPFVDLGTDFSVVTEQTGDVLARYMLRVREFEVSMKVTAHLLRELNGSLGSGTRAAPYSAGSGLGIVEAWRGTLVHRVELGDKGQVTRVKVVDPSFVNWPALSMSLADTIVPDFPLVNKSFNQSYAGNDL